MTHRRTATLSQWIGAALCLLGAACAAADGRDRVRLVGSSTVFPFATTVAETFGRSGQWKTPVVESTGTGGGFKIFCSGAGLNTPDINNASRPMTDTERQTCARHGVAGILALRIGYDGIVVASSRQARHFDLTRLELYRAVAKRTVFNGRLIDNPYRRWSDIDPRLPNQPISVLGPAPNHGTRDTFVALVMNPACEALPQIRALAHDEQVIACEAVREDGAWTDMPGDYSLLVERLTADKATIGILTLAYLDQNRDRIQASRIDGVAPTSATVAAWTYPMSRPIFVYIKTVHIGAVPGLIEFVREFVSERAAGQDGYLVEKGLTPLPKAWLDLERSKLAKLGAGGR
ncbi:MAG: substrate-binding domain-containing protein [Pseudomonadota bacterium]|nr:substrate-binding domain-containing protein [Pseudomonadota bacterium]